MKPYNLNCLFLLVLVVLITSSCGNTGKETETEETEVLPDDIVELRDDQKKLAGIETGLIEMRLLSGSLKVNGSVTVAPDDLATVSAPMGGYVKSASLIPGNRVSRGQTLAIIENPGFIDLQQNFLEARNKLEFSEAEFKRHTELYKNDVYSQQNLQQVTSEYKNLKAQVKALGQKLLLIGVNPEKFDENQISGSSAVVSPISGYVKTVNVNIGKFVSPSDVLFEIVNGDKLFLELSLYEKDADKVETGQRIRFYINNETEEHEALICETGHLVNVDKTFRVYASVIGSCRNMLPGMYVNAIIEAAANRVTALPSGAVVGFDDKDYIFTVVRQKTEGGKPFTEYRMIEVQKGITDGGYTEVRLPEGIDITKTIFVIKGAYNLLSAKKNAGEMSC